MTEHTPTPWYAEDWTDDNGSELVTVAAHELEVLGPGQSSLWPDGIRKIRIAETVDSPNPIADAAFIVKACNNYEALIKALDDVIATYEYCSEDPVDRGWAPMSDAIEDARRLHTALGQPSQVRE